MRAHNHLGYIMYPAPMCAGHFRVHAKISGVHSPVATIVIWSGQRPKRPTEMTSAHWRASEVESCQRPAGTAESHSSTVWARGGRPHWPPMAVRFRGQPRARTPLRHYETSRPLSWVLSGGPVSGTRKHHPLNEIARAHTHTLTGGRDGGAVFVCPADSNRFLVAGGVRCGCGAVRHALRQ